MSWTEERMEVLRLRWGSGFSATQIAEMLNHGLPKCDHITRNAVIGKARRMKLTQPGEARRTYMTSVSGDGLNHRDRYNAKRAASRPAKVVKAPKVPAEGWQTKTRREPTKPHIAPVLLTGAEKPWIDRKNGECCYPIGEGEALLSCCQPVSERGYCAAHFARCYVVGSAMKPRDVRHYERKAA